MASGATTTSASTKRTMSPRAARPPAFRAAAGPQFRASDRTIAPYSVATLDVSSVEASSTTMISSGVGTDRTRAGRHSRSSRELLYAGTTTDTRGTTDLDLRQISIDQPEHAVRLGAPRTVPAGIAEIHPSPRHLPEMSHALSSAS